MMQDFTLWLEFEHADYSTKWNSAKGEFSTEGEWNKEDEFCNIKVTLPDGRQYGINVWTFQFLQTAVKLNIKQNENLGGLYQQPPDLFVRELTRSCIEATIDDLLAMGPLEQALNPSIVIEYPEDFQ